MEESLTDDEGDFIVERLQNRKIRLEIGKLNTLKLIRSKVMKKYFMIKDTFLEIIHHHQILTIIIFYL